MITLVVSDICGKRVVEEVPRTHRHVVKTCQKMIDKNEFIDGNYSHRLLEFKHQKRNFTSFKVLIDDIDILKIDIHTQEV